MLNGAKTVARRQGGLQAWLSHLVGRHGDHGLLLQFLAPPPQLAGGGGGGDRLAAAIAPLAAGGCLLLLLDYDDTLASAGGFNEGLLAALAKLTAGARGQQQQQQQQQQQPQQAGGEGREGGEGGGEERGAVELYMFTNMLYNRRWVAAVNADPAVRRCGALARLSALGCSCTAVVTSMDLFFDTQALQADPVPTTIVRAANIGYPQA